MDGLLPPWIDLLTAGHLFTLSIGVAAWAAVGFFGSPWLEARFNSASGGYVDWMVEIFDKMFMEVPRRVCSLSILASMLVFGIAGLLLTGGLPSGGGYLVLRILVFMLLALIPGYRFPRFVVNHLWNRRIALFEEQMVDALSFMSNGLKSGLSLLQSMDMVREELPKPISQEFGLVMNEQKLGVPLEDALFKLEDRVQTEDLQIMVTSIIILRQSGGNLSETFDTISETIRDRRKVEGRIKTLTAQGVSQGVIIVIMPFALGFVLWLMDPALMSRMWTTALGWGLLAGMLCLQAGGAFLIKRFVTIRV